ncbi:MAG: TraR/DksA family transcriptional regulator [Steroidobacteraceae bacterium]|jgi:DnaK suppressor protein
MNPASPRFDQSFMQKQRRRLMKLRQELAGATRSGEAEEREISSQTQDEAFESEEDAQKLSMLEVQGTLVAHELRRLAQVERALAKIEEGTYGLSDVSGRPISKERLDAMPEALDTLEEQTVGGAGTP